MRALIFCGGLGRRLKPLTNNIPKPMVKVAGKPVLEYLIDHLNKFGITEIIVKLHYKPEKIYEYFGTRVLYSYEPKLLDVKETEKRLVSWLGKRYFILNGDTLTDIDISKMDDYFTVASWDNVWTGIAIKSPGVKPQKVNFKCWWQDIGTMEGLARAIKHYEKS